jgi:hypothetical protein
MKHHINVLPVAGWPGAPDDKVSVAGAAVLFNGVAYDLSAIPLYGAAQPEGDHPFVGSIVHDDAGLRYGLILKYDTSTALADQPAGAEHWHIVVEDADLPDLIIRKRAAE